MESNLHRIRSVGLVDVLVGGSFRPNGAAILAGSEIGPGWTVARTGVGLYVVTFNEAFNALKAFWAGVREAAGTPTFAQGGDFSLANRTVQIRVMQEAAGAFAAADLASDVNNVVNFMAMVQNTDGDIR